MGIRNLHRTKAAAPKKAAPHSWARRDKAVVSSSLIGCYASLNLYMPYMVRTELRKHRVGDPLPEAREHHE